MHEDACTQLDLAVLILSTPTEAGAVARQATRQSWAHALPNHPCASRYWFVLGRSGYPSSDSSIGADGDILRVDAPEGYRNVTLKVLASFRWLVREQPLPFSHVFKTDDDAFVCISGVLRVLHQHRPLYAGLAVPPMRVILTPGHKWQDLAYARTFRRSHYYDYFQGIGYALKAELARTVVTNADDLAIWTRRPPPANEDAWIGALARTPILPRHLQADGSPATVLPANRSLEVEAMLPAVQWTITNVTSACAAGHLMVHKLAPAELENCALAAAASPPFCHIRLPTRVVRDWWLHPPRSASGRERCACHTL